MTSRPSSWSSDESGIPFIQRRPRPGPVTRAFAEFASQFTALQQQKLQRMDPPPPSTTTAAADTSAAPSNRSRPSSPCICWDRLPNICRCVPRTVHHLFRNEQVPELAYFDAEWVRRFGLTYQAPTYSPDWLVARVTNQSPAAVRRRVLLERTREQWLELEGANDANERANERRRIP